VIAITDYVRSVPDQVSRFIDRPYTSLGTDGFGRSDARDALRSHFEVNAAHLVVATLSELARSGQVKSALVAEANSELGIDPERAAPFIPT
jgi:pyruvate dehydrogenase E1 component